MTPGEGRTTALEYLNAVLANNCTPPQEGPPPALLVGSPGTVAERLTAAAMAAHVWAGTKWPMITGGPLVEALRAQATHERGSLEDARNTLDLLASMLAGAGAPETHVAVLAKARKILRELV
jgi:hypothetical protein